jgi:hypothetical protein
MFDVNLFLYTMVITDKYIECKQTIQINYINLLFIRAQRN